MGKTISQLQPIWIPITVASWYGSEERTVEIVSDTAVWHSTGLPAVRRQSWAQPTFCGLPSATETVNLYSHTLPDMQEKAVRAMESYRARLMRDSAEAVWFSEK